MKLLLRRLNYYKLHMQVDEWSVWLSQAAMPYHMIIQHWSMAN